MEIVQACGRQLLYSRLSPLAQRKVISFGPVRKEKLLTMSLWPPLTVSLPLSHCSLPPSFFFFPNRKAGLRCQAVSWGPSGADSGGDPHPELHGNSGVWHWSDHSVVLPWQTGALHEHVGCTTSVDQNLNPAVSPHQPKSLVETKPYRKPLSDATEAVSILTIHSVNVTDTGPYRCNVTSIDATLIQQTQVIVYGKLQPHTMHAYNLTLLLSKSPNTTWIMNSRKTMIPTSSKLHCLCTNV